MGGNWQCIQLQGAWSLKQRSWSRPSADAAAAAARQCKGWWSGTWCM